MNIDVKSLRPVVKKKALVQDPPRYPEIIEAYEGEAQVLFTATLKKTLIELSEEMVKLKS